MSSMNTETVENNCNAVRLAADVQITEFDNSVSRNSLLIRTRNRHLQVDGVARQLLLYVAAQEKNVTRNELKTALFAQQLTCVTNEHIEQLLQRLLNLGVLASAADAQDNGTRKTVPKARKQSYFLVRIPIIPARLVEKICHFLSPLLSPSLVFVATPLLLVLQGVIWHFTLHHSSFTVHSLHSRSLILFLVGNYLGLLLHEFGHATACFNGGEKPGHVGLGIYLLFPVFYTDVSRAWALSRKKRLCVDIGGIYVSLVLAFTASLLFLSYHSSLSGLLAVAYSLTILACLNPFIKMDGYWFLSDLMGIPNLMNANREMSRWLFQRALGKDIPHPKILTLPLRLRVAYLVYYVFFSVFICYVTARFYLWYMPHLVQILPALYGKLRDTFMHSGMSWHVVQLCLQMLMRSLPLVLSTIYVIRLMKRFVVRLSARMNQQTEQETALAQ
jgi:putative peptide zinc metalloprotease protein